MTTQQDAPRKSPPTGGGYRGPGKVALSCEHCGKEVMVKPHRIREGARYCSRACAFAFRPNSMAVRFWSKVNQSGGPDACWPWTGGMLNTGYGIFYTRHSEAHTAPRIAWALTNGPLPSDQYVCHHCDNPPCCNPAHLFLGTAADNAADMVSKGRSQRGERHSQSKLTEEQVRTIRALHASGATCAALARRFGVHQGTIRPILQGRTWRHIIGEGTI